MDEEISRLKTTAISLLNDLGCNGLTLPEDLINEMCRCGAAELHVVAAFIGGIASQEVIKAASGTKGGSSGSPVITGKDMLLAEKECIYGSKPSPRRSNSFRKLNGYRAYGNGSVSNTPSPRRNSVGSELLTPRSSYFVRQTDGGYFKEMRRLSTAPLNFVAIAKEDTMSFSSVCGSEPESPPQPY